MKKYLGTFISISLLFLVGVGIYQEITKKSASSKKRIQCQKETTTFEKIGNKKLAQKAKMLLKSNEYILKSSIWKSKYSHSNLFNYISQNEIDKLTINAIKQISNTNNNIATKLNNKKLLISFYTRENDAKDVNKKSANSKLYAGYLVYEFKLDEKLIYKIQTDFMSKEGKDIYKRIECVFDSFLSI